jgi:hypothetical protein
MGSSEDPRNHVSSARGRGDTLLQDIDLLAVSQRHLDDAAG